MTHSEQQHDSGAATLATTNVLLISGTFDPQSPHTDLQLSDGQTLRISTSLILQGSHQKPAAEDGNQGVSASGVQVIPIIEEQLEVGKRTVVTGKVLLEKQVGEYHEDLDVPLAIRTFDVERVVLNQIVETPPPVRQEGDTTIYSLVEEQLVLTKQLILKEEVRVTKRDTERRDNRTITLKRETMVVTRTPTTTP